MLAAVRILACADASLAHVYGYHNLGVLTPELIGTPEQAAHWYRQTASRSLFWGNSLNPLDPRTTLTPSDDGHFRLNGTKSFCTGSRGSDLLLVSATLADNPQLQVMVVPTARKGITTNDDWDNMGQRQTDSGSVSYADVRIDRTDLLGPPGAGGSVQATLRTLITQGILSNIYLGLAQGAFAEGQEYTRALDRPFAGSTATRASEDPYILERYGNMHVQIAAAAALLDACGHELQHAFERGAKLTADERGACAISTAAAKVAAGRCALDVTSSVFDVMGARATAGRYRFDRFWRNARTLTLHDPLDYKAREVGEGVLNGRWPVPSFYS
jgi:alkylation response protein AidB-like acyl-CoA dehydrogenase